MSVYDKSGVLLNAIYGISGSSLNAGYAIDGEQIFPDDSILTSFDMFYPNDASGAYQVAQGKNLTLTADQFLALRYDDYVSNPPVDITVTKTSLGKDSTNTYDIWEYSFKPTNPKRKILLMSGEHAYETTASFGLAHLIYHIYRVQDNRAFAYIRKNVEVKVVPIFNPWGFNQVPKEYGVYGGINPERNFNYNGLWEMFTESHDGGQAGDYWNKKGDYPFQTAETKTLARWQIANQDADFIINCHTGETENNRDVWIDYMTQTPAASPILAAVAKNETEFKTRFNRSTCRTEITGTNYPNSTGYGMHGAWNMFCVKMTGFTNEQAPHNTIFGNGKSNSAGAINNYASITATYVLEMLLDKYQSIYDSIHPNNTVPITGVSGESVSFNSGDYSKTVSLTVTPTNTTQFTFEWSSSDESVCEVWGTTNEAVIVKRGSGTATITATNLLNSQVTTQFTVSIQ